MLIVHACVVKERCASMSHETSQTARAKSFHYYNPSCCISRVQFRTHAGFSGLVRHFVMSCFLLSNGVLFPIGWGQEWRTWARWWRECCVQSIAPLHWKRTRQEVFGGVGGEKKADIYASGGSFFRHTDFPSDPSLPFLFPQLPLNV